MMQQSSALQRLEEILTNAVKRGDRDEVSGLVLLTTMNLTHQPRLLVDFYEILNKAEEEARTIKNNERLYRYIQTIEELQDIFIAHHMWREPWSTLASKIEVRGVLNTLDALARFFSSQNPATLLDQDFLEKLETSFKDLLDEILKSDLSNELKRFLIERVEDILRAVRRYHIDGTEGLEKAAKSMVTDLVMAESNLKEQDKSNPKYRHVKALVLGLLIYIAPTPYDIIGAVPDIHSFWKPQFEEFTAVHKEVEQIVDASQTIQEVFEKASNIFDRQQKAIAGSKELKALSASKENLEDDSIRTKDQSADQ